jgi:hypothetical protein
MSARWQLMLGSVDPEGEKCAPEGRNSDEWADDEDRPTEGSLDHHPVGGVDATIVRRRKGHVLITDGPFAETKE